MGDSPKQDTSHKGFKQCALCKKVWVPLVDPHENCFSCLGLTHEMDKCSLCLAFEPRAQRSRFIRHLLWRKRAQVTQGLEALPPKSDLTLALSKAELKELGVPDRQILYYSKTANYSKVADDLTDSDAERSVEGLGGKPHQVPSTFDLQDSICTTQDRASDMEFSEAGDPVTCQYGGRVSTGSKTVLVPSSAGARFSQFKSLTLPSNLGVLGGALTSRGVQPRQEQAGLAGQLDQIAGMVQGFASRLDVMESSRAVGVDVEAPVFPQTSKRGVEGVTSSRRKRFRLDEALDFSRSQWSQEDMEPEEVSQGYDDFLKHMAMQADFESLVATEVQEESVSSALTGRKVHPPAVTVAFNQESSKFFEAAMKVPKTTQQPSKSPFKIPRQTYQSICKAPVIDEEVKFSIDSSRTLGPTRSTVSKWDHSVDSSFEAHMATFRLGHHSSLMATFLDKVAMRYDDLELTELAKFHMQLSQEVLRTSAFGAASAINLKRSMALSLTEELSAGSVHDKIMSIPYTGGELFGSQFMEVIDKTSASQERLAALKVHLKQMKPQSTRGRPPYRGRGRGIQRGRGAGAYRGGQQSATVTSAAQAGASAFYQPPFRGAWRGRGGRASRGGAQRGTSRGRGGYKATNQPSH